MDTVRLIALACRSLPTIKTLVRSGASPLAIFRGMAPLHDLSFQTVALRSGLRLGLIRSTGS